MKIFNICNHQYKEVDDKGYQYCIKCGRARFVGIPECNHTWKIIQSLESSTFRGNVYKITHVLQCTKCGKLEKYELNN